MGKLKQKPEGMDITVTFTFPNTGDEQMTLAIFSVLEAIKPLSEQGSACLWTKLHFAGLSPAVYERLQQGIQDFHDSKRSHLRLAWDADSLPPKEQAG